MDSNFILPRIISCLVIQRNLTFNCFPDTYRVCTLIFIMIIFINSCYQTFKNDNLIEYLVKTLC